MMKNKYKIIDDTLIVYNRKDNREILFDAEDFSNVNQYTWRIHHKGYVITDTINNHKKKIISAHRWLMNFPVNLLVDHENGNKLDNHKSNLRIGDDKLNNHNRTKAKGYYWYKKLNKWKSQIQVDNKTKHLGYYETEIEARAAYLEGKKKYHPTAPLHLYK